MQTASTSSAGLTAGQVASATRPRLPRRLHASSARCGTIGATRRIIVSTAVSREAEGLAFSTALASSYSFATALLNDSASMCFACSF